MNMAEPVSDSDLQSRFHYHSPTEEGVQRHHNLSEAFTQLATLVRDTCPSGRERSLAFTQLEQAKFWASAAVARDPVTR